MTLSERISDVRACTHIGDGPGGMHSTSENGQSGPRLRVVPPPTHTDPPPPPQLRDDPAQGHLREAVRAASEHPVAATLPPTVAEALENLWLDRDEVRHGLTGQLAAAAAGLFQALILSACWGVAHVFGASKTRAAICFYLMIAAVATWALAAHT